MHEPAPLQQPCPICGVLQHANARYPRYLCPECAAQTVDDEGRRLSLSNVDLWGGFRATRSDTGADHPGPYCYVRGRRCIAEEARFGGIVVQTVDDDAAKDPRPRA